MIELIEKEQCTGCSACSSICPQRAISMLMDNEGFYYPVINEKKCVSCGLCKKTCPIEKGEILSNKNTFAILAQNMKDDIRTVSSAGGIVGAIYSYVFSRGGVAFGSGLNIDNTVSYEKVESLEQCYQNKIFSSKYTTSFLGDIFIQVKNELLTKRLVCFVGLPCHVAGLKNYLKKEFDNLILVDLTCYGVPSGKLYKKYIDFLEDKYKGKITDVRFRDKSFGYASPTMSVEFDNYRVMSQNSDIKSYLRCFFKNLSSRPSCYQCNFKTIDRVSDLTVGDCRSVYKFSKEMDDNLGTTVIYVHSSKGENILSNIETNIKRFEVPIDDVVKISGKKMVESAVKNQNRDAFFSEIDNLSYNKLINKYCPPEFSEKIANLFKWLLLVTGLNKTNILKKIKK